MSSLKVFFIPIFIILSSIPIAQAAVERDQIIQKAMDCVDQHLPQGSGISWNDVCDVIESPSQQHIQVVNEQMDQLQGLNHMPKAVLDPNSIPRKREMLYTFAPEISSITYHEPGVKEKGVFSGINGIVTYRPKKGNPLNSEISDVYRLEARFDYGKVNYDGGLQNSDGSYAGPDKFNGISDYMLELRGVIGKDYYFNYQLTRLTPYFGGGYRSLFDAFYANKPYGYNRRIQYAYLPIGSDVLQNLIDGWSVDANMEYDFLIQGTVTSYLGNIGEGNLTNTQKHGFGLRGSIKFIKYFRYWHIHTSKLAASNPFYDNGQQVVAIGYEPDNNSLEVGGQMGVEF